MQIIPFEPSHLTQMELQPAQRGMLPHLTNEYGRMLSLHGGWTAIGDRQEVIACAGIVQEDVDRAFAWALLSAQAGYYLSAIHKKVSRFLQLCACTRLETVVDRDFIPGHRWMRLLGFEREGTLKHFYGRNHHVVLYARYHTVTKEH